MSTSSNDNYLPGRLIVAMPNMLDPRFTRTVVYLCAHNEEAAMGLVVNRLIGSITFPDLLEQLEIDVGEADQNIRVHFGGPVECGRGFVLHSSAGRAEQQAEERRDVSPVQPHHEITGSKPRCFIVKQRVYSISGSPCSGHNIVLA